jgi:hypothetical protein
MNPRDYQAVESGMLLDQVDYGAEESVRLAINMLDLAFGECTFVTRRELPSQIARLVPIMPVTEERTAEIVQLQGEAWAADNSPDERNAAPAHPRHAPRPNFYQSHPTPHSAASSRNHPIHRLAPITPTMSKNVRDSTRFTATGVWAHTKPGGRATTLQFADPAPKNETPQQKVKRLREAANRAKMAQVTRWDYMYLYGRMAADAAHRAAVYGIIFTTGTVSYAAHCSL